jgi:hypothetical protein
VRSLANLTVAILERRAMNTQYTRALILICTTIGLTQDASPQNAEKPVPSPPVAAAQTGTNPRPVNLKALSRVPPLKKSES